MSMALVPVLPAICAGKCSSLSTVFGMDHNDKISDFFLDSFPFPCVHGIQVSTTTKYFSRAVLNCN